MNVALDTTATFTSRAGAARYIRGLQRGFEELAPDDFRFTPIAWEVENLEYRQPARMLKTMFREFLWAPLRAPAMIRDSRADLFHSPSNWFINPPSRVPHVVTLHDLALLRFPERFRPWLRHSGRCRLKMLKAADRILCISRFTADEAMELLNLPASKLEVIHHGNDFAGRESLNGLRPPVLPYEPFFLFVGSLEPGKNLAMLRETYELAQRQGKQLPHLAVAGARWAGVAGEGVPPKNWHYLGHVSDDELVWLYRHAQALLFPTKYEGFGFPMLEAMSLGCPVVASKVASLPEIGGEAVCWCSPNAADYLAAMMSIVQDDQSRDDLRQQGLSQAAGYSWKRCAAETLEFYRKLVG